jgi:hypothetical protein
VDMAVYFERNLPRSGAIVGVLRIILVRSVKRRYGKMRKGAVSGLANRENGMGEVGPSGDVMINV